MPENPKGTLRKETVDHLGLYQVTLDFIARISLPVMILVVVLIFKPEIKEKLKKAEELNLLGFSAIFPAEEKNARDYVEQVENLLKEYQAEPSSEKQIQTINDIKNVTTQYKTVEVFLTSINTLPSGSAFQIIQSKPTELTSEIQNLIQGMLGQQLENATEMLRNDDPLSKKVLKYILILLPDYSPDDLAKWEAAIKAQQ